MNTPLRFTQICVFLFIILAPIHDFFLQGTPLRSMGASPSLFPLLALALVALARWLMSGNLRINRVILMCLTYAFAITAYGFFVFGLTSHGESLIWKSTTTLIWLALVVFAINNIDYQPAASLRAAVYVAFILMVLGFCFGSPNPFGLPPLLENNPIVHFTPTPDPERPRGLASEPSMLSISAMVFGLLCAHVARHRMAKIAFVVATVALLLASGSKGGILTLFLCLMVLCIMKWHSRWYHVPGVVFVLLPAGLALIWMIPTLFPVADFAVSGTIPTRLSMTLCALMTVRHHPFGVGLGGMLPSVSIYLPSAMYTVQSLFPVPLAFNEVSQYLISADMVGTKSFFFDQLMRFGIPFAVFFFIFVTKLLNRLAARHHLILLVAVLASTIAVTTYSGSMGLYPVPILFGVALSEVRNGANTGSSV